MNQSKPAVRYFFKNVVSVAGMWIPLVVLFSTLIFSSCTDKPVAIPPDVLGRDTMVILLARIHVAEAQLNIIGTQLHQPDFKKSHVKKVLIDAHIDPEKFNRSFDYYSSSPTLFDRMYDEVIIAISQMQAQRMRE